MYCNGSTSITFMWSLNVFHHHIILPANKKSFVK